MAQGILGGFRNKVGTVIGFFWKGKAVMRGYKDLGPKSTYSEEQLFVQTRFGALGKLALVEKVGLKEGQTISVSYCPYEVNGRVRALRISD